MQNVKTAQRKQKKTKEKVICETENLIFSTVTRSVYIPKLIRQNLQPESCPRNIFNGSYDTQEGLRGIAAKMPVSIIFRDNSCFGITQK